ncbi:MAG: peptide-methionine (R)-S-oxide reductase MsrB [Saprospiraceae bacterium]|nr:peptide-methionine (R)-S-oxide reductase MsrB [Saprospiraceae bacterium]MBP7699654.1 peptide-methionine (R)-S-oxide reductase MsrB [Saprospiraceae bacterium]
MKNFFGILLLFVVGIAACTSAKRKSPQNKQSVILNLSDTSLVAINKSEEAWNEQLSPEAYTVLREKGTERAFSGAYWDNHDAGIYRCAACNLPLFNASTKFDSGTGWPSFTTPINDKNVATIVDESFGMERVEVLCTRCRGHLGHVFEDGPAEKGGLRYCINSVSLYFEKEKGKE